MQIGRMCASHLEYACKVKLPAKWDGPRRFCGYYRPLNHQTSMIHTYPLPLIEDVLAQLGKSTTFSAHDLYPSFWQIRMVPEDIKKITVITKNGLFEWLMMPFGLKNAIGTLSRVMNEIFRDEFDSSVKVFVNDFNIHAWTGFWKEHLPHLRRVLS